MGMRNWEVFDYGLLINKETANHMASVAFEDYEEKSEYDWQIELSGAGIGEYISEFTGGALKLEDNGYFIYSSAESYAVEPIFYISALKLPTLFSAAYKDMEELIKEFKDRVGEYLPYDFDYRNNIRYICGTYYG